MSKFDTSILNLRDIIGNLFKVAVCCLLLFPGATTNAQVTNTAALETSITFASIARTGTSFTGWRNGTNIDDNLLGSTAIGFNFAYDGGTSTTFSVSKNSL